jgi:hypothetical protein
MRSSLALQKREVGGGTPIPQLEPGMRENPLQLGRHFIYWKSFWCRRRDSEY